MKVFRVAVDSSCLIGLAQIDLFRLLKELFSEVYTPDAVYGN
jgi:predicted nucleic acid-binding protein